MTKVDTVAKVDNMILLPNQLLSINVKIVGKKCDKKCIKVHNIDQIV